VNSSTYLRRFRRLLLLGAVIAGATASTAGAVARPPDVRDAATVNATVPDVFERYARAHPYGGGLSAVDRIIAQERGRHGDLAVFGSSPSTPESTVVVRPPDVRDAAEAAATVSTGQGDGFDWADYGIGIGSGIGLSLLLAAALGAALQRRGRVQTA
jgi:hypothetical protein